VLLRFVRSAAVPRSFREVVGPGRARKREASACRASSIPAMIFSARVGSSGCNTMTLPYQCLAACSRKVPDGSGGWLYEWALFGATGSQIVVQSSNGATSTWTMHEHQAKVSNVDCLGLDTLCCVELLLVYWISADAHNSLTPKTQMKNAPAKGSSSHRPRSKSPTSPR
jgi:hypothetical protein